MLFQLGQTVMTSAIANVISEHPAFQIEIINAMQRYVNGDWGEMCGADSFANDKALAEKNDRIFAAYETTQGKIWIITEWDRSYTTILFPADY
jgi:hypothetical protein